MHSGSRLQNAGFAKLLFRLWQHTQQVVRGRVWKLFGFLFSSGIKHTAEINRTNIKFSHRLSP